MRELVGMVGRRFGRLTVLRRSPNRNRLVYWECQCDCGQLTVVRGTHLRGGRTQSCGCLNSEITAARNYKHGGTGTGEYVSWREMLTRCFNPNYIRFDNYGGRGITVWG